MIIAAKNNLTQLLELLMKIGHDHYIARPEVLFGASVGEHYRHIIEFYLLLVSGSFTGAVNYDNRERNIKLASCIDCAKETIQRIIPELEKLNLQQLLNLEADYSTGGNSTHQIPTSIGRELAYCVEHSIHHQAIIKTGIIALGQKHLVDDQFGVAYSTIRYKNSTCAQ